MKELAIIIFIIAIVVIGSIWSQKYLETTSSSILEKLEELKDELRISENDTKAKEIAKSVLEEWEQISEDWSMLVVHEELDKIQLSILKVNSSIEANSIDDSLEEIDNSIFLVGHIKEKESFKIKNIF